MYKVYSIVSKSYIPFFCAFLAIFVSTATALPFDPNNYSFLIYNPGGNESSITQAMERLDISFDERDSSFGNNVTSTDLSTHNILIVGWNNGGDTSGLDSRVLLNGIKGRVVLTGHDLDYHTIGDAIHPPLLVAQTMLIQAIDYVLKGNGCGLIVLGCSDNFAYLPEDWGVTSATPYYCNYISLFTSSGLASGIFNGLSTQDMCNWSQSYHNSFTTYVGSNFVPFELGNDQSDFVTVVAMGNPVGHKHVHILGGADFWTIQSAVDAAVDGNTIVVDPGTYNENVNIYSKQLTIRSVNPENRAFIENTIIAPDSDTAINAGDFWGTDPEVTIEGLTVHSNSHGIASGTCVLTVRNCILDCTYNCLDIGSGTTSNINNCEICSLNAYGVFSSSDSTVSINVTDCVISGTATSAAGVTVSYANLTIQNCQIRNWPYYGISLCNAASGKIYNNTISGNSTSAPLLIDLSNQGGTVEVLNNMLYRGGIGIRVNGNYGGVIKIRNNTIACNTSNGLFCSSGLSNVEFKNNIVWNNATQISPTNLSYVTYSCVQNIAMPNSNNNTNGNPNFAAADQNDFHISSGSSCINAGETGFTPPSGETDIDGGARMIGNRIDIGADEFANTPDFNHDDTVNFIDYAMLAGVWGQTGYSGACDLYGDGTINNYDLGEFVKEWLVTRSFGAGSFLSMAEFNDFLADVNDVNEPNEPNERNEPAQPQMALHLVCENLYPDPNSDVTLYVQSDVSLSSLGVYIEIAGDATITGAMNENDCNQFGWDPGWWSEPDIDPNGTYAFINGLMWDDPNGPSGDVGYFTIHYNSGPVTITVANNATYDANQQPVAFDSNSIILGGEQQMMMPGGGEMMMESGMQVESMQSESMESVEAFDAEAAIEWLEQIWLEDAALRASMTEEELDEFIEEIRNSQ